MKTNLKEAQELKEDIKKTKKILSPREFRRALEGFKKEAEKLREKVMERNWEVRDHEYGGYWEDCPICKEMKENREARKICEEILK